MNDALQIERSGAVLTLWLNRPELHNAFDAGLIARLTAALEAAGRDDSVRALVVAGHGASFSAGADMQWMRGMAAASEADNREDSLALARLMRTLDELPKPTLARVHGAAFGGGVGLVACCDIAIASTSARFGLTESRLGLLPAVISPYVIEAIGPRQARRWFATGEHFDAETRCASAWSTSWSSRNAWTRLCSASWPCSTRPARSLLPAPSSWCGRCVTAMTAMPWIAIMPP